MKKENEVIAKMLEILDTAKELNHDEGIELSAYLWVLR
jgi:hypothetical protein